MSPTACSGRFRFRRTAWKLNWALGATHALNLFETRDFGDIVNDLKHGPSIPATITFRVRWSGKTQQFQLRNAADGFRGEFVKTAATMEWIASEANSSYASLAADTSTSLFAVLGREHNGVFWHTRNIIELRRRSYGGAGSGCSSPAIVEVVRLPWTCSKLPGSRVWPQNQAVLFFVM